MALQRENAATATEQRNRQTDQRFHNPFSLFSPHLNERTRRTRIIKLTKKGTQVVGRERFELSTFRLSAERSNQAELPAPNKAN